jgi:hypothetical protein
MGNSLRNLVFATAVAAGVTAGDSPTQAASALDQIPHTNSPILTTNPILDASLRRISRGSALWREAVEAVRKTGRRVVVVTTTDAMTADNHLGWDRDAFDPSALAEAVHVVTAGAQVAAVVIVVTLDWIQEMHNARLSVPRYFEADLDRILVHEIYGHGIPYVLAGDLSARCADPRPGDRASDACSIRRENAVRAELGLATETTRGFPVSLWRAALNSASFLALALHAPNESRSA